MELKVATPADAKTVFLWRNHERVRAASLNTREIRWEHHLEWFVNSLSSKERVILLAYHQDEAVGVLRFDLDGDVAEVSIFMDPDNTGKGLGGMALQEGVAWARQNLPEIGMLTAKVRPDNPASLKLFAKAGFNESWRAFELVM